MQAISRQWLKSNFVRLWELKDTTEISNLRALGIFDEVLPNQDDKPDETQEVEDDGMELEEKPDGEDLPPKIPLESEPSRQKSGEEL